MKMYVVISSETDKHRQRDLIGRCMWLFPVRQTTGQTQTERFNRKMYVVISSETDKHRQRDLIGRCMWLFPVRDRQRD